MAVQVAHVIWTLRIALTPGTNAALTSYALHTNSARSPIERVADLFTQDFETQRSSGPCSRSKLDFVAFSLGHVVDDNVRIDQDMYMLANSHPKSILSGGSNSRNLREHPENMQPRPVLSPDASIVADIALSEHEGSNS